MLVGHSGGGLAAYLLALRSPGIADGAGARPGAPLRAVAWVQEALDADDSAEPVDIDPSEMFSTHPEYVHALLHDPLTWHGGFRPETLRAVAEVWPEVQAGLAGAGLPDVPVLFVHGEADPVVPLADAQANAGAAAAGHAGHLPRRPARRPERADRAPCTTWSPPSSPRRRAVRLAPSAV